MLASRFERDRPFDLCVKKPMEGNVTVGVSTTNKWQSRCIRYVMDSPCSHAWIAYDSHDFGIRRVLQAEWYGFEDIPWSRWQQKNILVAEFYPVGNDLWPSVQWLAQFLGSDYDYKSAFFLRFGRYLKTFCKTPYRDPHKLMCSEAVCRALDHAGYPSFKSIDPESVDPKKCLITWLNDKENFIIKWISDTLVSWLEKKNIACSLPSPGVFP